MVPKTTCTRNESPVFRKLYLVIEIAWSWLRNQPNSQLSRWSRKRFAKGSSRVRRTGIGALARKLAF